MDVLDEVHNLIADSDRMAESLPLAGAVEDLEYRCMTFVHRLLASDFTSLYSTGCDEEDWKRILEGACKLTVLIYFGRLNGPISSSASQALFVHTAITRVNQICL